MKSGWGGGGAGGRGIIEISWYVVYVVNVVCRKFSYVIIKWVWVFWAWIKGTKKVFLKVGQLFTPSFKD